jgi:hypothetical protein
MQRFAVPIFVLLVAVAAALIYVARPSETAYEFAQRKCKADRPSGITFEKCVESRMLQHLAGREDIDR